jgi:hypothetical protein
MHLSSLLKRILEIRVSLYSLPMSPCGSTQKGLMHNAKEGFTDESELIKSRCSTIQSDTCDDTAGMPRWAL